MSDGSINIDLDGSINIDLDQEELDLFVHMYVHQALRRESVDVFNADIAKTGDVKQALYHAVINDLINDMLEAHLRSQYQTSATSGTSE